MRVEPHDYHAVAAGAPDIAREVGKLAAHRIGGSHGLQGIASEPPPPRAIVVGGLFLGSPHWGGRSGSLVLEPPYPHGATDSNHLVFSWKQSGRSYAVGLHAWETLLESVATLRALVESFPD